MITKNYEIVCETCIFWNKLFGDDPTKGTCSKKESITTFTNYCEMFWQAEDGTIYSDIVKEDW